MLTAAVVLNGSRLGHNSPAREQILNAAIRCYQKSSFKKTSLEDIAQEANISRATIYRHFENRNEILVAVALIIVQDLKTLLDERVSKIISFDDFVVETIVVTFDQLPRIPFFYVMIKEPSLATGLTNNYNEKIFEIACDHFESRFEVARASGLLRSDMDFPRFIEWIIYLGSTFIGARSVQCSPAKLREMLRYFLVPGIIHSPASNCPS